MHSTADVPLSATSAETTSGKTSDNGTETHYTILQRGQVDDTGVSHHAMHRFYTGVFFSFQNYVRFEGAYVNVVSFLLIRKSLNFKRKFL